MYSTMVKISNISYMAPEPFEMRCVTYSVKYSMTLLRLCHEYNDVILFSMYWQLVG